MAELMFGPHSGAVESVEPTPTFAPAQSIPTDTLLVIGQVHSKKTGLQILPFQDVDELFSENCFGTLTYQHSIPNISQFLKGDRTASFIGTHDVRRVRDFGYLETITQTRRNMATGLDQYPLLAMAVRCRTAIDFVERLDDPGFRVVLETRRSDYLEEIDASCAAVRQIGQPLAQTHRFSLVGQYLGAMKMAFDDKGSDSELLAPSTLVSADPIDATVLAESKPLIVRSEQFHVPQRDFILDRLVMERLLAETYQDKPTMVALVEDMVKAVSQSSTEVFQKQLFHQQAFYSLQQAAPRGSATSSPKRIINRSLTSMTERDYEDIQAVLPGPRALDYRESVDTLLVLEEPRTSAEIELVGKFAKYLRAVAVLPVHCDRSNKDMATFQNAIYGSTLFGIRSDQETWKRNVALNAGSYMAATENPVIPSVRIPNAALAAGLMISNSDKTALAPAGDQMLLKLSGELTKGVPAVSLINPPDAKELPGVNRVCSRTHGGYMFFGAATLSAEHTWCLVSVTRTYNELLKNVSEICNTRLFMADTPSSRQNLEADINSWLRGKSGDSDNKPFNGGLVRSIRYEIDEATGRAIRGTLVIKIGVNFKYLVYGVKIEVRPDEVQVEM